jgi:acyl-CoA synthetase (AMP-forming)/AMP-acid ligase II
MLAFVAVRDGCVTNEDDLREHARRGLADSKLPDKIVFLEKLPKGISGKIQRTSLDEAGVPVSTLRALFDRAVATAPDDVALRHRGRTC